MTTFELKIKQTRRKKTVKMISATGRKGLSNLFSTNLMVLLVIYFLLIGTAESRNVTKVRRSLCIFFFLNVKIVERISNG